MLPQEYKTGGLNGVLGALLACADCADWPSQPAAMGWTLISWVSCEPMELIAQNQS